MEQGGEAASAVTLWLARARAGDDQALGHAFADAYQALKRAAHLQLRRGGGQFNTTALVNETYLKLNADAGFTPEDRSELLALSASAMREVLVDHSRRMQANKRGGDAVFVTLPTQGVQAGGHAVVEVLELHSQLLWLEQVDARGAKVVELRYFGGYSETEIAEVLGVTLRTVQRDWRKARAYLMARLA